MESPTGIIPDELFNAAHKRAVIKFLREQPYEAEFKSKVLRGWAVRVGTTIRQREYREVEKTGIDR